MSARVVLAICILWPPVAAAAQDIPFAPARQVNVNALPGRVIGLADLNRDKHFDLVATARTPERTVVNVYLGDGKGGFAPLPSSTASATVGPYEDMLLTDINRDGVADLVVAAADRDAIRVLVSNGQGGFVPVPGSPFLGSDTVRADNRRMYVADINEDGNTDAVTSSDGRLYPASLSLFLGDGRGRFTARQPIPLGGKELYTLLFGDVDGDTHADVVMASAGSDDALQPTRVSVLRGDGRGGFATMGTSVTVPPGARLDRGALADVNADGHPDLILTHAPGSLLSVLLNSGGGRYAASPGSPFSLDTTGFQVVMTDANRDGKIDIVASVVNSTTQPYSSAVGVLAGDGRGGFSPIGTSRQTGAGMYFVASGDVNEDGKLDVVGKSDTGSGASDITVLLGR